MSFNNILFINRRHSLELYHNWTKVSSRVKITYWGLSIPGIDWLNDVNGTRKKIYRSSLVFRYNKSIFKLNIKFCLWMCLTAVCLLFCLFVCLFEFIVPLANFSLIWRRNHWRWRAANFDLCRHSWLLSSVGSATCHTYYDTGLPFIMVISEDPWHSHLLPSVWQWSCHNLILRLRSVVNGVEPRSPACEANAQPLRHRGGFNSRSYQWNVLQTCMNSFNDCLNPD